MRVACVYFSKPVRLHEFAAACLRFSPKISVIEPSMVLIEIGKCKTLYSEEGFIARVQVLLRRFETQASVSIASDVPTAMATAQYSVRKKDDLPVRALLDYGDPFHIDSNGRKSMNAMIDALTRLGVSTLKDFKKLPRSHFPSRFGALSLYCIRLLDDASHLAWKGWSPPQTYSIRHELLPQDFCGSLEPLLFKSKTVLDQIFSQLRGHSLQAERIVFSIELDRHSRVQHPKREWTFELITPQSSTHGFLPILRERMNRDLERTPLESDVIAVQCDIPTTVVCKNAQSHFFHQQGEYSEKMGSFFGQLEEYLGKGQVFWSQVTEERFPEKSWKRIRLFKDDLTRTQGIYPKRPTRLLKAPLPITVLQDSVAIRGKRYKTVKWSVVERISMDWIDDQPSRNYYSVELEDGKTIWVYSDPSHHYFMHGYFE